MILYKDNKQFEKRSMECRGEPIYFDYIPWLGAFAGFPAAIYYLFDLKKFLEAIVFVSFVLFVIHLFLIFKLKGMVWIMSFIQSAKFALSLLHLNNYAFLISFVWLSTSVIQSFFKQSDYLVLDSKAKRMDINFLEELEFVKAGNFPEQDLNEVPRCRSFVDLFYRYIFTKKIHVAEEYYSIMEQSAQKNMLVYEDFDAVRESLEIVYSFLNKD